MDIPKIIKSQSERAEIERLFWNNLDELAEKDDVVGFYTLYAQYLEWNNIISRGRRSIYKMAIRASQLLSEKQ
jgi:hypothetical protein